MSQDVKASDSGINIPQIAACALIGYFVFRWFFKSSDPAASSSGSASNSAAGSRSSASSGNGRRTAAPLDPRRMAQQVEVVRGMFPVVSAAAVEAELTRNGGSIEIAAERILSNGFLPEPPNARPTEPSASESRPRRPQAGSSSLAQNSVYTDLITRYGLRDRLAEEPPVAAGASIPVNNKNGKAPASKAGRHMAHKEKRDQMVLEARRKLEKMISDENAAR
ncbi:hypothetical protein EDC01DRAFT_684195 [Geopyxis carbonaria]|nr:hypothetical protein EDC01DRAFT_684195 [Geopyxis carbonaria]